MTDDFHEPFGPDYVRPAQAPCANCACCSAVLCERGRNSVHQCAGLTDEQTKQIVSGCPCSAATTPGTHAWRLARIKATTHATERPMRTPCALLLRVLANAEEGAPVSDPEDMLGMLKAYGYAGTREDGLPVITDLGRRYLQAREEPRFPVAVEVTAVDLKARTATVIVGAWDTARPVTILLDQLQAATKLAPVELPGTWVSAEVNCQAAEADELVLTKIRVADLTPQEPTGGGERDER
jgi:hypothetical protein